MTAAQIEAAVPFGTYIPLSEISITKEVAPTDDVANQGTITYTVVISNGTAVSDTNALFTDTLPISTTFGSWIEQPGGASESGDEITWSGTLTNNTAITLSFTAVHTGTYEDVITNTAEYSGSVVISDTATFTVVSSTPNLSLVKTADPETDAPYHGFVTYTLTLANGGTVDAVGAVITDDLPSEVSFDHWVQQSGAVEQSDFITWTGTVTGADSVSIVFVVTSTAGYEVEVTNTTYYSHTSGSGSDSVTFTVQSEPFSGVILINELDADTAGTEADEFLELYDGGVGNTSLDGLVVVLYNGNGDVSYNAFDLDGYTTDANGYLVIGGTGVASADITVNNTYWLQNGADAAAIYQADATDFPNGTAVTTNNLLDAIVYDTNDAADAGLLVLLNAGQPQVNEDGAGDKDNHSNQRCPNGSGDARNTDTYAQFTPTPGAANDCGGPGFGNCGDLATLIHDIQGNGASSPEENNTHVIEGVVVGDFQDTANELGGFFLQEEDTETDTDPTTSEGIFVYDNGFGVDVVVGDVVRVMGNVAEYFELTELNNVSNVAVCDPGVATAATINLPIASLDVWEQHEGMLINIPQTLYATGNYDQGHYGEVDLSVGDRLYQPTNVVTPGAPALALQALNDLSRIQLEDGSRVENPLPLPPYIGAGDTLRAGDTIPELTGVLSFGYGDYEIHPTGAVNFTRVNPRDATPPPVGTTVKVASFNVLNYFTTLNDSGPICGPASDQDCRGADTADEFTRQRDKIIDAIVKMDADVIGLMELENHPTDDALQDLVDGLNDAAGAGTYALIDTGTIGTDAIKVAFIYRPGTVTPVGPCAILDSSVDPLFLDTLNRPVLAQTFEQNTTGERFTAAVNHLKSKGSDCNAEGDPDMGDGQGNCNQTRTNAAIALTNWLATDPTGSGDPDFLIIGDLNAYAMEDPIAAITTDAGYTNLIESFVGLDAYSYSYYGQSGYLDHALSNPDLTPQVTGVVLWHINADEPRALDYNDYNQPDLYNPDQYRASDHDPVIVGLNLGAVPVGGVTVSVSKMEILMPWVGLVALGCLILAAGAVALRKRTG